MDYLKCLIAVASKKNVVLLTGVPALHGFQVVPFRAIPLGLERTLLGGHDELLAHCQGYDRARYDLVDARDSEAMRS